MGLFGSLGSAVGSFFGGPTGGSIGGAIGGFFDSSSARDAANKDAAKAAAKQRQFEADMSNTAIRRRVTDLRLAGLNPMLAYSQGGASTPSGATASTTDANTMINSGFTQARVENETQAARASIANTEADTDNKLATADNIRTDTALKAAQIPVQEGTATKLSAEVGQISQMIRESIARVEQFGHQNNWTDAQIAKVKAEIPGIVAQRQLIQAQTTSANASAVQSGRSSDVLELDARLKNLAIPRAFNESDSESSWWKKHVAPYLPDFLKSTGVAGGIHSIVK